MAASSPDTPGSSRLSEEQSEWFLRRYGARYTHVQWQPQVPNRKTRRRLARAKP